MELIKPKIEIVFEEDVPNDKLVADYTYSETVLKLGLKNDPLQN
jgi:hypothetical protein